jgi:hypothetical protein
MLRNPVSKRSVISISLGLLAMALLAVMILPPMTRVVKADERSGELQITKNCSASTADAGTFCTIKSSNLPEIPSGSRVFYTQALVGCDTGATAYPCTPLPPTPEGMNIALDSNAVLYVGNGDWAVGRCTLDGTGSSGLCTFSDGIGPLTGFHARVLVSFIGGANYDWKGTYSFDRDHR